MKTFKQYISEADEQLNRRGFLRGLAAFAASAAVPAPVTKLLSTPAGIAAMPIPAGIALLKGIQEHLNQWDPEDDDDYYEAWEDMAGELGFEDEDAGDEYGESAQDQLADIVNLYRENPELAAAQLIKHLQTNVGVSAKEINPSFASRADNPNDWRYQRKQADAKGEQIVTKGNQIALELRMAMGRRWKPDAEPEEARSNQIINELLRQAADKFDVDINAGIEFWRKLAAQSGRDGFDDAQEEIYLTLQSNGIDPKATSGAAADSSNLANIARLAGLAKGAGSANNQEPAATVKHMGPVQYTKDIPALPAPTKPEFDLAPNLKQKEKVPVNQRKKDDDQSIAEDAELSGILKSAGLKTSD